MSDRRYSRRDMFRLFTSRAERVRQAAVAPAAARPAAPPSTLVALHGRLRPPGWSGLAASACAECNACVEACPPGAIVKHEDGTPLIYPAVSPCVLCDDLPCVGACPSGVLQPTLRTAVRMGTAEIIEGLCRHGRDEPCIECYTHCPLEGSAIRLVTGGPAGPQPVIMEEACTGCGSCLAACPERPRAIRITS